MRTPRFPSPQCAPAFASTPRPHARRPVDQRTSGFPARSHMWNSYFAPRNTLETTSKLKPVVGLNWRAGGGCQGERVEQRDAAVRERSESERTRLGPNTSGAHGTKASCGVERCRVLRTQHAGFGWRRGGERICKQMEPAPLLPTHFLHLPASSLAPVSGHTASSSSPNCPARGRGC